MCGLDSTGSGQSPLACCCEAVVIIPVQSYVEHDLTSWSTVSFSVLLAKSCGLCGPRSSRRHRDSRPSLQAVFRAAVKAHIPSHVGRLPTDLKMRYVVSRLLVSPCSAVHRPAGVCVCTVRLCQQDGCVCVCVCVSASWIQSSAPIT
jgi:hypothetical protein